jgi:hypothetical protein
MLEYYYGYKADKHRNKEQDLALLSLLAIS